MGPDEKEFTFEITLLTKYPYVEHGTMGHGTGLKGVHLLILSQTSRDHGTMGPDKKGIHFINHSSNQIGSMGPWDMGQA